VPAVAGMSLGVLLVAAFVTLTSQTPTPVAVAASAPSVNMSVANSILEPAVQPSFAPALADRGARREVAQRRATRAAPQNERAAATRNEPRTVASAPATTTTVSPTAPVDDAPVKLPRLDVPTVPRTATTVNLPKADDVISNPDPIDTDVPVVDEPVAPVTDKLTGKDKAAVRRSADKKLKDDDVERTISRVIKSLGNKSE
jgi:hypothetical protein